MQIGTLGTDDIPLPVNQLMAREISLIGSMRYGNVFDEAIRLVQSRRIKAEQLISDVVPLTHIADAMAKAAGKGSSLKVQLAIDS